MLLPHLGKRFARKLPTRAAIVNREEPSGADCGSRADKWEQPTNRIQRPALAARLFSCTKLPGLHGLHKACGSSNSSRTPTTPFLDNAPRCVISAPVERIRMQNV